MPTGDLLAANRFVRACELAQIDAARLRHVLVFENGGLTAAATLCRLEAPLDALSTGLTRHAIAILRRLRPSALRLPIMFCGLPVSFGGSCLRLAPRTDRAKAMTSILEAMEAFAAETDTDLLCVKELDSEMQAALAKPLQDQGFVSAPSLPGCKLKLPWRNMDEYRASLRAGYRRQLNSDRRAAVDAGLESCASNGLAPGVEEVHLLYSQVIKRARFKLESLPRSFFSALVHTCGEELHSVVMKRNGSTVANAVLLGRAPTCYFLLAGLNYAELAPGHVYPNLVADVVAAAIHAGASTLELGQTSYAMKTRLGAVPTSRFLWLKHRRPALNQLLAFASPWLFPQTQVPLRRVFRVPRIPRPEGFRLCLRNLGDSAGTRQRRPKRP